MTICHAVEFGEQNSRGWRARRCSVCGTVYNPMPSGKFEADCPGGNSTPELPGPGWHLKLVLSELGIRPDGCAGECHKMAAQMDAWGPAGCREHKQEIVAHLHKAYSKLAWHDVAAFAARAVASGLAFKIGFGDAAEWLVEESIRRSEAQLPVSSQADKPPEQS